MASQGSGGGDGGDSTTATIQTTSRLAQMQMRFQQKQQMEREQRRLEMTANKLAMEETITKSQTTTASSTRTLNSSIVPGKVRQMFDERRRGTGIDKSYPLKPLTTSNSHNQRTTSGSSGNSSSGGSVGGTNFLTKKTSTINTTKRNGNIVTNRIATTTTATTALRKQQSALNNRPQQNTGLKKPPLNGRFNQSRIKNEMATVVTAAVVAPNKISNNNNHFADSDDEFDYIENQNNNNNNNINHHHHDNYNNNVNDNDYNDYVDNGNNENFIANAHDDDDDDDGVMNATNKQQEQLDIDEIEISFENDFHNNLDEESFPDDINMENGLIGKKLPNIGKLTLNDRNNNNTGADMKTNLKLKPVITRKTLPPSPGNTIKRTIEPKQHNNVMTTTKRVQSNSLEKPIKTVTKPNSSKVLISKTEPQKLQLGPPSPGMAACKICGRHFNIDRVEKHEVICHRAATKKRKIFDSTKHRVKGTEAEIYLRKLTKTPVKASPSSISTATKAVGVAKTAVKPGSGESAATKKSNWRKKHEEFIAAIRAAKEVQKHLARGGKLSDLPPPPPSENPDYVQCPHCSRRFNEAAAHRHIPKCASMMHNKPKPKSTPKKKF